MDVKNNTDSSGGWWWWGGGGGGGERGGDGGRKGRGRSGCPVNKTDLYINVKHVWHTQKTMILFYMLKGLESIPFPNGRAKWPMCLTMTCRSSIDTNINTDHVQHCPGRPLHSLQIQQSPDGCIHRLDHPAVDAVWLISMYSLLMAQAEVVSTLLSLPALA